MSAPVKQVDRAVGLTRIESVRLMSSQNQSLLEQLRGLAPEEWAMKTDCDPWTVKDITAHILGAAEGYLSFGQLRRQLTGGLKGKRQHGNFLDAMNQVQVDDRAGMTPREIVDALQETLPRFERFRQRAGAVGKAIPFYEGSLLGATNVAYLMNTIYTRDIFMHRIDISRATSAPLHLGSHEKRLIEDVLVDWSKRTGAAATVHLAGPAGGSYAVGTAPIATIEGDAVEMIRVLAGRGRISSLNLFGNVPAAERWLTKGCPF